MFMPDKAAGWHRYGPDTVIHNTTLYKDIHTGEKCMEILQPGQHKNPTLQFSGNERFFAMELSHATHKHNIQATFRQHSRYQQFTLHRVRPVIVWPQNNTIITINNEDDRDNPRTSSTNYFIF